MNFSKNRSYTDMNEDILYEKIYRIAKMYIVSKETPLEISKTLDINYSVVIRIIEAKKQNHMWLDAIASLGRKGLIE